MPRLETSRVGPKPSIECVAMRAIGTTWLRPRGTSETVREQSKRDAKSGTAATTSPEAMRVEPATKLKYIVGITTPAAAVAAAATVAAAAAAASAPPPSPLTAAAVASASSGVSRGGMSAKLYHDVARMPSWQDASADARRRGQRKSLA